jgi:hypothetical protein
MTVASPAMRPDTPMASRMCLGNTNRPTSSTVMVAFMTANEATTNRLAIHYQSHRVGADTRHPLTPSSGAAADPRDFRVASAAILGQMTGA